MGSDLPRPTSLRLLIAGPTTPMLRDILLRVASARDAFHVIDEGGDCGDVALSVRRHHADVVLLGLEDSDLPAACRELMERCKDIIIVAFAQDGKRASVFSNDLGPQRLIETIRLLGQTH